MTPVALQVLGSINLDLVASGAPLPMAGETVTGASLARYPGGKGANQALAARRLGANVRLIGRVGHDPFADEALGLLRTEGVDLSQCSIDPQLPTGVALIAVSPEGENQIIVASGANLGLTDIPDLGDTALLCQLELQIDTVAKAVSAAKGFVAVAALVCFLRLRGWDVFNDFPRPDRLGLVMKYVCALKERSCGLICTRVALPF